MTFEFQPVDEVTRALVTITEASWLPTASGAKADFGNCEGWTGFLVAEDVESAYKRAQVAGREVIRPLAASDYESQEFVVRDPEGNPWSIGTYPGEKCAASPS